MAMASVLSRAQHGMEAPLVRVEADIGGGLPTFLIVGLAEAVVKESKDRVRAAITNCGFEFPSGRITVNLSPADLPKEGCRFDLPIAISILLASTQLPAEAFAQCELFGELSLSGEVRPVRGALLAAVAATRAGHTMIIPPLNANETGLVENSRCASLIGRSRTCARHEAAASRGRETSPARNRPVRGSARSSRTVTRETRARNRGGWRP
jgi:magnesium chelatase family protein